ncbi:MAG TPA: lipoyl synthase [Bacteroidales bacterium]|jgi:lipoic acid synthetase|nr:lipoyl synthase [Bacteroidales bacterium]OQB63342.1 MAG: Lipoyl synthase [Bacteroidetes bacterium ADurb.Bin145]NMD02886.1 lipoyl synthase [Bacteroidales bacterium]HOU01774.1 lipoyl synthase [Bacteroidales bacterium]HQG62296.1 lipoyl synthase [Bacteroidales bacterium]
MGKVRNLPEWFKMQRASGENYSRLKRLIEQNRLHTICTSGNCPNKGECWNAGTSTFMILGDICTRACRFCNTRTGKPLPPDPEEPVRLAETIRLLGLKHCVITSVDRDDLPDGGAEFWSDVISKVREINPAVTVECLIPDFDGKHEYLDKIIAAGPDVISHNVETVRRLTPVIRTKAKYDRSLSVINYISLNKKTAKSGFMLGLGENEQEIDETMDDLLRTGCEILTIGQYLKPSPEHMDVVEYVSPERFEKYRESALEKGFRMVESAPLVRSSFHAEKHITGG